MAAISLLVLLVLVFVACFAGYVLAPITGALPSENSNRFQLSDVFSLVVVWQYPLAFVRILQSINPNAGLHGPVAYALVGAFIAVVTALWWGLVTTLSRRGVQSAMRRFVVIAAAVPLAIAASLVLLAAMTALIVQAIHPSSRVDGGAGLLTGACLTTGVLCRMAIVWALKPAPPTSALANAEP